MADLISLREVLVSLGMGDVWFLGICLLVFLFGNVDFNISKLLICFYLEQKTQIMFPQKMKL